MLPGMTPVQPGHDGPMCWGTVGWASNSGSFYDLGDGSTGETGRTLVQVTLFRGRDPSVPLDSDLAQGTEILCQLGNGFFRIPPKGTAVLVAVPTPHGDIPGASIIVHTADIGAPIVGNIQPGEWCIGSPGGVNRIIGKNNGAVCMYTQQGNTSSGASVVVQINPDGSVNVAGPFGGFSCASAKTQMVFGTTSAIQCDANGVTLIGPKLGVNAGSVSLGATPTDGIVVDSKLLTQLTAITTWAGAVATALSSAGFPIAGPTATLVTALAIPNGSLSCKVSQ